MKLMRRTAIAACAAAAAVLAFATPASAVTLNFYANGPADWSRGCDLTTKAVGTYTYYENGGVKGGYQSYAGGFDAYERDLCSDGYGAALHLTYYKWNGSSWVYATANPIKVTTGVGTTKDHSWTFKDVRDVKVYSCRINSSNVVSSCARAVMS
ncbi:hypothetical protein G6045_19135 [Streptomyces sp. YC504]|uniref:Tat pathway signal sequence domain protein n=1 Tax=Streptomyces mesophilus TaxID=1775132 RepID=A0A6G4XLQ3_9ACTN|nr:hypothetical protein [Streptomyces mesophilus]NGO77757.1 hypothetical protein [Streptomyces mesophilus]